MFNTEINRSVNNDRETSTESICIIVALFVESFNGDVAIMILKTFPIMVVIAMVLEGVLVGRIAEKLVRRFTKPTDSFNAKILFRILFTVIGMSACMTLIGNAVGDGFSTEIFSNWVSNWPRNFIIVLTAETLVIQPIARFAMVKLHASQDKKMEFAEKKAA